MLTFFGNLVDVGAPLQVRHLSHPDKDSSELAVAFLGNEAHSPCTSPSLAVEGPSVGKGDLPCS